MIFKNGYYMKKVLIKNPVETGYVYNQKMASDLHHTATTMYPCCVPALGDSKGAGCVGLAIANLQSILALSNYFHQFYVTILIYCILIDL